MKLHLAPLLVFLLSSPVLSLMCYNCVSEQCSETECPGQCASLTRLIVKDGKHVRTVIKTCAVPEICSSESINLGEVMVTQNAMCCNSTLCNKITLPVFPLERLNGKMCHSCKDSDCSHTVDCVGKQDHCITQRGNLLFQSLTTKGCAYKSACSNSEVLVPSLIGSFKVECCEGNLCNVAEIHTLSFLLMIVAPAPFIFFS